MDSVCPITFKALFRFGAQRVQNLKVQSKHWPSTLAALCVTSFTVLLHFHLPGMGGRLWTTQRRLKGSKLGSQNAIPSHLLEKSHLSFCRLIATLQRLYIHFLALEMTSHRQIILSDYYLLFSSSTELALGVHAACGHGPSKGKEKLSFRKNKSLALFSLQI